MFFTQQELDSFLEEDLPYFDLTTFSLGIGDIAGEIAYVVREDCLVCGTEEVARLFQNCSVQRNHFVPSGTRVTAGSVILSGTGSGESLNHVWKVGQNILDHCSAIATKTSKFIDIMAAANSKAALLTTRKGFPGTKKLATKAILTGGAMPHRLGLSESILIFEQHLHLLGGQQALEYKLASLKSKNCEKKIIVETSDLTEAETYLRLGADGIQFDKVPATDLQQGAVYLKSKFPQCTLLAAGGINEQNLAEYAKCTIDGIVTTSLYHAKPIDIGVKMMRNEGIKAT